MKESQCVIIGTPVYYAYVIARLKIFMEGMGNINLVGKLGGAFATVVMYMMEKLYYKVF